MAGGLGKRMESDIPKVCHCVNDVPMIVHVIKTALQLNPDVVYIIVGQYKSIIESTIAEYRDKVQWITQDEPLGTGHAILCGLDVLKKHPNTPTLILSGDVPLVSHSTLVQLLSNNNNKMLVTELINPTGCGRILLNAKNQIVGIREEKDCTHEEKNIKLVNCGIYQINSNALVKWLPLITNNNNSREYYLTDIVGLLETPMEYYVLPEDRQYEVKNINTKLDLEQINQRRI